MSKLIDSAMLKRGDYVEGMGRVDYLARYSDGRLMVTFTNGRGTYYWFREKVRVIV